MSNDVYNKKVAKNKPVVSIVTATFNAVNQLPSAIKSIRNQRFEDFEWIIIDAGSKDGTVNLIQRNEDIISYWVSEPDQGIYDAWNKGLRVAKGDWICFLGADDLIMPDAIYNLLSCDKQYNESRDFIYGRVELYDNDNLLRTIGEPWRWCKFKRYFSATHPCALHSASYFKRYGEFDTSFRITGDYEMLLRAGSSLKVGFQNSVVAHMQIGGVSNGNTAVFQETLRARLKHNLTNPISGGIYAKWSEVKWYLRRYLIGV